jgi:hypothetical protein
MIATRGRLLLACIGFEGFTKGGNFLSKWRARSVSIKNVLHAVVCTYIVRSVHAFCNITYVKTANLLIFLFCWPCISIYACNETNLMHYLSSVYSVTIPVHVSGLLVAHHQEVTMYICDNWYVLYVLADCRRAWKEWNSSPFNPGHSNPFHTLLPPGNGLLTSPKHVEVSLHAANLLLYFILYLTWLTS